MKIGGSQVESHQDDQSVGEVGTGGKIAGIGCDQPGEGSGRSNQSCNTHKVVIEQIEVLSSQGCLVVRGKGHKGEIPAGYEKNPSLWEQYSTAAGCLEKW